MGLFRFLNQWREKKDGTLEGPALSTDVVNSGAPRYAIAGEHTLLEALQDVPIGNNGEFTDIYLGEVIAVPKDGAGAFGAVDFRDINGADDDTPSAVTLSGVGNGTSTSIVASGQHGVTMSTNDAYLKDMSVRQADSSGSYDAVYVSERESKIEDVAVDHAPRSALRFDGNSARQSIARGCELAAGDSETVYLGGTGHNHSQMAVKSPPNLGLSIRATVEDSYLQYTIDEPGGQGCFVADGATNNEVHLVVRNPSGPALRCNGVGNIYHLTAKGGPTEVVDIDSEVGSTFYLNVENDVLLDTNSENNILYGKVGGTVTDNGTNNDTSNLA